MENMHFCVDNLAKCESLRVSNWWKFFSDPDNHSFMAVVVAQPTNDKELCRHKKPQQDKGEWLTVNLGGETCMQLAQKDLTIRKLVDFMKRFDASPETVANAVKRLVAYQRLNCGCQPPGTGLLGAVLDPMEILKKKRIQYVPAVRPQSCPQPLKSAIVQGPPLALESNGAFHPFKREECIRGNNSVMKKEALQPLSSLSDVDLDKELQQLNLRQKTRKDAAPAKQAKKRSVAKMVEAIVQTRGKRTSDSEGVRLPQSSSKRSTLASAPSLHVQISRGVAGADPRPSTSGRRGQVFRQTSCLGMSPGLASRLPSFESQTSSMNQRFLFQGQKKTQGQSKGQGQIWSRGQGQRVIAGHGQASQVALPVSTQPPSARSQVLRFLRSNRSSPSTPGKSRIPWVEPRKK